VNEAVIIIPPPVIITNGAELHGPMPLWLGIFLIVCAAGLLAFLGWLIYDDWKWNRRYRR
jgi:hypothetical protein